MRNEKKMYEILLNKRKKNAISYRIASPKFLKSSILIIFFFFSFLKVYVRSNADGIQIQFEYCVNAKIAL